MGLFSALSLSLPGVSKNEVVLHVYLFCLACFTIPLDANVHAARSAPKSETAADVTN